jgi:hypothetical protein
VLRDLGHGLWAGEQPLYDAGTGECAGGDPSACLHYAAMVSRNVTAIGCGAASCAFGRGPGDYVVCLYSPVPRRTVRGRTAS